MSPTELANHIQSIECKYASFTNKLSLALQYGTGNLECLQNNAFVIKSSLDILNRFYSDGMVCSTCNLEGTWILTHFCGNMVAPYTTYSCYYSPGVLPIQDTVDSYWEFNSDATFNITAYDGTEQGGGYSLSSGILTLTGVTLFPLVIEATFTTNCNSLELYYDNPNNAQTITAYFTRLTGANSDCSWAEYCITEEEVENLIKTCYKLLSSSCNC